MMHVFSRHVANSIVCNSSEVFLMFLADNYKSLSNVVDVFMGSYKCYPPMLHTCVFLLQWFGDLFQPLEICCILILFCCIGVSKNQIQAGEDHDLG
jgi:hypothetical protein